MHFVGKAPLVPATRLDGRGSSSCLLPSASVPYHPVAPAPQRPGGRNGGDRIASRTRAVRGRRSRFAATSERARSTYRTVLPWTSCECVDLTPGSRLLLSATADVRTSSPSRPVFVRSRRLAGGRRDARLPHRSGSGSARQAVGYVAAAWHGGCRTNRSANRCVNWSWDNTCSPRKSGSSIWDDAHEMAEIDAVHP